MVLKFARLRGHGLRPFLLVTLCGLALVLEPTRAVSTPVPALFNSAQFRQAIEVPVAHLLDAGKLVPLSSLARPTVLTRSLPLPHLFTAPISPPDLRDKLLASTFIFSVCHRENGKIKLTFGTAFAVAPGGILATCAHELPADLKIHDAYPVIIDAQARAYPVVEILAWDPTADICILRVQGGDFPPLPLQIVTRIGDPVYCLSHPSANFFMFTSGLVSRLDTDKDTDSSLPLHLINVTCDYSPGSSGAPIVDACGNVIAQVDRIYPGILWLSADHANGTGATVFNLHIATAAEDILRLLQPGPAAH